MASIVTNLTCELTAPVSVVFLPGNMFSMDNGGNIINVFVVQNGEPVALGGSVSANVIRSDGTTVAITGALEGNKAYIILPQACYAVPGIIHIVMKITEGTTITTIAAVTANVYQSSTDAVVDPGTLVPSIAALIEAIEDAVDSIPVDYSGLLATLAADYSTSKTYKVGDYAWYGGVLKRCIVAITTAESYTAAHWTNAVIGDDLSALKSAFDSVTSATRNLWTFGDQAGTKGCVVNFPFVAGKTYTIACKILTNYGTSGNSRISICDSASYQLAYDVMPHEGERHSITITAPEGATKIIFYARNTSTNSEGYTLTVTDIQIEEGTEETAYIPPVTADDFVVREKEDALEGEVTDIKGIFGTGYAFTPIAVSAGTGRGSGKYWNIENTTAVIASSANYYAYDPIPVSVGDSFKVIIFQQSSTKQAPVVFVNSEYSILATHKKSESIGAKIFEVTAPATSAFMLLTTGKANISVTDVRKRTASLRETIRGFSDGSLNLKGKNVAILGDSISTNGQYDPDTNPFGNVPEIVIGAEDVGVELSAYVTVWDVWANLDYDTPTGLTIGGHTFTDEEIGTEVTFTPVEADIGKVIGKPANYNPASTFVWWEAAQEKMGFNPVPACWSGSSLTSHEGGKKMYKTSYAWHPAMIRKCGIRIPGTMTRIPPDVIIVYRGTNDFSHEPYVELTRPDTELYDYPGNYPDSDGITIDGTRHYGLMDGMMMVVSKMREAYPQAVIVFCTLNVFKRVNYEAYPTNNGINTLPQYNDIIRRTAESLGCYVIDFANDGITFENCYSSGYVTDNSDHPTHPSNKGHLLMAKRAMLDLARVNSLGD